MRIIPHLSTGVDLKTDKEISSIAIGEKQQYYKMDDNISVRLVLYKADLSLGGYTGIYHHLIAEVTVNYNKLQEGW